jgi:hypothetical protein
MPPVGGLQRADHGSARALPPAVSDLLCQLKDDEPKLTLTALIKKARAEHPALVTDEVRLAEPIAPSKGRRRV